MSDPTYLLRAGESGTVIKGTPGNVLAIGSDGESVQPVPGGAGLVSSVFGRIGAVVAVLGDYAASLVSNDSGVAGTTVADALDTLEAEISVLVVGVSSVFGRSGAVTAQSGDYGSDLIANDSGVAGANVSDALDVVDTRITALNSDNISNNSGVAGASVSDALDTLAASAGAVDSVFGRIGVVVAAAGDYVASLITNDSTVSGVHVDDALDSLAASIASLVVGVSSVFGRSGAVTAQNGDYTGSQITGTSTVPGATVKAELDWFASQSAIAGGSAPAVDFTAARVYVVTLNQNAALNITLPPAGLEGIVHIVQPAAGGPFTATFGANVKLQTVASGGGTPSFSTVANTRNTFSILSDGAFGYLNNEGEFA